jgi:flagellar biosynthetic protein FlhB
VAGEKTEAPTGKRRGEARKRGQVARSPEVNSAALMLVAYLVIVAAGANVLHQLRLLLETIFRSVAVRDMTPDQAHAYMVALALWVGQLVAPIILAFMLAGVLASVGQTGLLLTFQPLKPNLQRLNVIAGLQRLVARRTALMDLGKALVKMLVIGFIVWRTVEDRLPLLLSLALMRVEVGLAHLASIAFEVLLKVALALLVLAVVDYWLQRKEHERALRMTKHEVKEEQKQSEGDPAIKSRIKRQMRSLAMKRMMQRVPRADVVITNPTHLAIALAYDPARTRAPVVVAKGADYVAERIRAVAREHGVPVVENRPLAQALYRSVEIDQPIPVALYQAVAEVLAFVYALKRRPVVATTAAAVGG